MRRLIGILWLFFANCSHPRLRAATSGRFSAKKRASRAQVLRIHSARSFAFLRKIASLLSPWAMPVWAVMFFLPTVLANQSEVQLKKLLSSYTTYQANFLQSTRGENGGPEQKSNGRVMLQRPGKFRWETQQPMQQLIVANGKILWIYDHDLEQVTEQQLQSRVGTDPAALLTGDVSGLVKQFSISGDGAKNFVLVPRDSNDIFEKIRMQFEKGQLVKLQIKNNLGQTTRFIFTNIRLNQSFDPSIFEFIPPAGVDVLKQ